MGGMWPAIGLLWLRLLIGVGIATHGYDKVFGGHLPGFIEGVARLGFPAPAFFAWAAALSELVGGGCVVLGLWTRAAAFCVFLTMSVALFVAHADDPFHVKELAYVYWAASGALTLIGGGGMSLERWFARRRGPLLRV